MKRVHKRYDVFQRDGTMIRKIVGNASLKSAIESMERLEGVNVNVEYYLKSC